MMLPYLYISMNDIQIIKQNPKKVFEKHKLSASISGHFQDMYALSQSPYALHSPILLAEVVDNGNH
jgi:hypothetical protein